MEALIFAGISYFGWAVGDIFGTVAARKLGGFSTTFWSLFLRIIIFSLYIPFIINDLQKLTPQLLVMNYLLGLVGLVGFISFNQGLKVGNAALVGTLAAAFPFVSVILSLLFLNERVTPAQGVAILIIFIGLILASINLKILVNTRKLESGVLLGLLAMVSWGIFFAFVKVFIVQIGWFLPNYIAYWSFPFALLFMKFKGEKLASLNYKGAFLSLLFAVILLAIAEFSYNIGIDKGKVATIAPIAGSYPTLFVVLAFLVFKDPITRQQILGIIVTLLGIVTLSFLSL